VIQICSNVRFEVAARSLGTARTPGPEAHQLRLLLS